MGTPKPTKGPKPTKAPKTPRPTMLKTPRPTMLKTPRPTVERTKAPKPAKEPKTPRPTATYMRKTPTPAPTKPQSGWSTGGEEDVCPREADAMAGEDCNFEGRCSYGERECCGEVHPMRTCHCTDGITQCIIYDDACSMGLPCPQDEVEEMNAVDVNSAGSITESFRPDLFGSQAYVEIAGLLSVGMILVFCSYSMCCKTRKDEQYQAITDPIV